MKHPPASAVFWLMGLPASGKTTLARRLLAHLQHEHRDCVLYDADEQRATGILRDLGWSPEDRIATIEALAHAALRHPIGIVTLVTSTPAERQLAADLLGERLHLIHVRAPEQLRHARDALRPTPAYRPTPAPDAPELSWTDPEHPALTLDTTAPLGLSEKAICSFADNVLRRRTVP
ncbi:adenylyl-sulfate kinase [Kitasatospora sp. NA04385]|uniref:adenylyl-sulfate kinase n=1 Tax=Kitasatospora sp. NA04385 TaxID=2742135 RepID=UPI00159126B1|nr:adenylyl-sulfate kinase [Kitasatospora sp. NA04385]QKW20528.1 adenylyl-sulfate kinase [Kitasatospora sp. NA04385]